MFPSSERTTTCWAPFLRAPKVPPLRLPPRASQLETSEPEERVPSCEAVVAPLRHEKVTPVGPRIDYGIWTKFSP